MAVRDWRHVYASITGSDRLSRVSFEARWLYVCLLVHQDDAGMFPWTLVRVRELTATCEWTYAKATTFLKDLEAVDLISIDGDMVLIRRGSELNGIPKSGSKNWIVPRYYPRFTVGISPVLQRPNVVPIEEKEEKEEKEERSVDPQPSVAPTTSKKQKTVATDWTPPDWFGPLTNLSGYNEADHGLAAAAIEAVCARRGVAAAVVVKAFCDFWPQGRALYEWKSPVKALVKTVDTQINKLTVSPAVAARNGSRPASAAPIPTIWMPSMGAEHRGEGSSIKMCGLAECKVAACLGLRRKVGVVGESGKPALVQERAVAPS